MGDDCSDYDRHGKDGTSEEKVVHRASECSLDYHPFPSESHPDRRTFTYAPDSRGQGPLLSRDVPCVMMKSALTANEGTTQTENKSGEGQTQHDGHVNEDADHGKECLTNDGHVCYQHAKSLDQGICDEDHGADGDNLLVGFVEHELDYYQGHCRSRLNETAIESLAACNDNHYRLAEGILRKDPENKALKRSCQQSHYYTNHGKIGEDYSKQQNQLEAHLTKEQNGKNAQHTEDPNYGHQMPQLQEDMIELRKESTLTQETRNVPMSQLVESSADTILSSSKAAKVGTPSSWPTVGNLYSESERALVDDKDPAPDVAAPTLPSYITKNGSKASLIDDILIHPRTDEKKSLCQVENIDDFDISHGPQKSRSRRPKMRSQNEQENNKIAISSAMNQEPQAAKPKTKAATVSAASIASLPSFRTAAVRSQKSRKNEGGNHRYSGNMFSVAMNRSAHPSVDKSTHSGIDVSTHFAEPIRHQPTFSQSQSVQKIVLQHDNISHYVDNAHLAGSPMVDTTRSNQSTPQQCQPIRRRTMPHNVTANFNNALSVGSDSLDNASSNQISPRQLQQVTRRSSLSNATKTKVFDDIGAKRELRISKSSHSASRSHQSWAKRDLRISKSSHSASRSHQPIQKRNAYRRATISPGTSLYTSREIDTGIHFANRNDLSIPEHRRPLTRSTMGHFSNYVSDDRQRRFSDPSGRSYNLKANYPSRRAEIDEATLYDTRRGSIAQSRASSDGRTKRPVVHDCVKQDRLETYAQASVKNSDEMSLQSMLPAKAPRLGEQGKLDYKGKKKPHSQFYKRDENPVINDSSDDEDDAASVDAMVMSVAINVKAVTPTNLKNRVKGISGSLSKDTLKKNRIKELEREVWKHQETSGGTIMSEDGTMYGPTPSRRSLNRLSADVECWLEHCREPIALKQVQEKRNSIGGRISAHEYSSYNRTLNSFLASECSHMDIEPAMIREEQKKKSDISREDLSVLFKAAKLMKSMHEDIQRQIGFMENHGKGKQTKRGSLESAIDLTMHTHDEKNIPTHRTFPKNIFRVVCLLAGNDKCCDCASSFRDMNALWASVTYGILVCAQCSFYHLDKLEVRLESVPIYFSFAVLLTISNLLYTH